MGQSKAEKKIQKAILAALRKIPGVVAFPHTATPYSPTGHADIYGSVNGYSFWAEVKRPGEEPTPIQRAFLKNVGQHSPYRNAFVWHNSVEAIKDIMGLKKNFVQDEPIFFGLVDIQDVTPPPIMPQSRRINAEQNKEQ